jgi:hypothetical protein
MNGKGSKPDRIEIGSDQLKSELIEIKERVGALETIASISNRAVVEAYVKKIVTTAKMKEIMRECEEPRTREYLISQFRFQSGPALDYHLRPLREGDLIQQHFAEEGRKVTYQWSNLFRRLPKSSLREILGNPSAETGSPVKKSKRRS